MKEGLFSSMVVLPSTNLKDVHWINEFLQNGTDHLLVFLLVLDLAPSLMINMNGSMSYGWIAQTQIKDM